MFNQKFFKTSFIVSCLFLGLLACSDKTSSSKTSSKVVTNQTQDNNVTEKSYLQAAKLYKEKKYKESFEQMKPLAEQNHMKAQFMLAVMYERGWGTSQSYPMALQWYEKAANQGGADAQVLVADMYFSGLGGTPVDKNKAKFWLEKAAKQGNQSAKDALEKYFK